MKPSFHTVILLIPGIVLIFMTGCSEPLTPDAKQARLIAAENMQLKKDIEQLNSQIEQLNEHNQQQIENLETELSESQEQVQYWQEKSQQNIRDQVQSVLDVVLEQNAELHLQIETLEARIDELEADKSNENETDMNPEPVIEENYLYP